MSAESFAALRRNAGSELADLAEEHYKHEYVQKPPFRRKILLVQLGYEECSSSSEAAHSLTRRNMADTSDFNSLQETDRDNLQYAAKAFSTYSAIGSGLGLGLGLLLAFRVRSARQKMFAAL